MSYRERLHTCPRCGFEFDLIYSRAVSCQDCPRLLSPYALLSCDKVRCPRCDNEFSVSPSSARAVHRLAPRQGQLIR
jgi:ribosomal protein S27E